MEEAYFSSLKLSKEMLRNIDEIGFKRMTPIQNQSLPHILEGRDVIAQAETGSGKTAAFGIGILSKLEPKNFDVRSLVLCPTRELSDQVAKELRMLARFKPNIKILTLCGGAAFGPQLGSLRHGAHIVVGTPGRVLKHLKKDSLNIDNLDILVLDEADRMLDMGFKDEIDEVLSFVPEQRQTLLFSATYTDEVTDISKNIQIDPVNVKALSPQSQNKVSEHFYEADEAKKLSRLVDILANFDPQNVIVFANTKVQVQSIAEDLQRMGIDALGIHGDLEQYERFDVLVQFANKSTPVLVATDVAARGLDIKELSMVVNYDLPQDKETYIHRIGRTARVGMEGLAVALYTKDEEQRAREYALGGAVFEDASLLKSGAGFKMEPMNITLVIEGGKKEKVRAGDILGALTGEALLCADDVGKIDIYERQSYVAIRRDIADEAYEKLKKGKIKGKKFPIWML